MASQPVETKRTYCRVCMTQCGLVADVAGESVCCRASDDTCVDCGYAACTELTEFQRLRPSALLGMLRYW